MSKPLKRRTKYRASLWLAFLGIALLLGGVGAAGFYIVLTLCWKLPTVALRAGENAARNVYVRNIAKQSLVTARRTVQPQPVGSAGILSDSVMDDLAVAGHFASIPKYFSYDINRANKQRPKGTEPCYSWEDVAVRILMAPKGHPWANLDYLFDI